jgi:hypothetical protein
LRNDRLQNVASLFKANAFYEGKTVFGVKWSAVPKGE